MIAAVAPVPIGLALNRTARVVTRAFDETLTAAGGSLPVWLVLLNLTIDRTATQRALADVLGLREATLSHHLAAMEADGLVTRRRDEDNRRVQIVELTDAGRARFAQLRDVAIAFDVRLRTGIADDDVARVGEVLARLAGNVE
jgi:MarR family transcriptional regulator, transcriptional regulator for hemolysin